MKQKSVYLCFKFNIYFRQYPIAACPSISHSSLIGWEQSNKRNSFHSHCDCVELLQIHFIRVHHLLWTEVRFCSRSIPEAVIISILNYQENFLIGVIIQIQQNLLTLIRQKTSSLHCLFCCEICILLPFMDDIIQIFRQFE